MFKKIVFIVCLFGIFNSTVQATSVHKQPITITFKHLGSEQNENMRLTITLKDQNAKMIEKIASKNKTINFLMPPLNQIREIRLFIGKELPFSFGPTSGLSKKTLLDWHGPFAEQQLTLYKLFQPGAKLIIKYNPHHGAGQSPVSIEKAQ